MSLGYRQGLNLTEPGIAVSFGPISTRREHKRHARRGKRLRARLGAWRSLSYFRARAARRSAWARRWRRISRPRAQVFAEVDEALGAKLSAIIFEGPADTLTLTENAQPALMAVSLATMRVLEAEAGLDLKRDAQFVAGHSLGEYSALAASRRVHHRRHRAAAAHARAGHAEGGAGRRRRHGGADRARIRRGGRGRGGSSAGTGLPGRQRQWRRPGGGVRRQGRGRARGGDRQNQGRQARDAAAGVRALPLRADAAGRRCDGAGAGDKCRSSRRWCRWSPMCWQSRSGSRPRSCARWSRRSPARCAGASRWPSWRAPASRRSTKWGPARC